MKNTFTKQLPHLIPLCAVGLTLLIGSWNTATAQDTQQTKNVYLNLSLEELNQLDVTSVTGVEEQWFKAPAAIYVITPEDIQRTGHRTLADLLRIVPGLNVASSSSNTWSVGARGIRGHYSDSLLVQIDGRSIDDPLAAFGHWDTVDMILQDISNIEVIRGPGTTLWGADAVSGVINVTTKPAKETQGWLINTVTGTYEQAGLSMRYGGQIDDNAFFKVWGKGSFRDAYERVDGSDAHDDWSIFSGGFRIDNQAPDALNWSVHGGATHSNQLSGTTNTPNPLVKESYLEQVNDGRFHNFFLQANLDKQVNVNNKWSLMASYDHSSRTAINNLQFDQDKFNLDYRHRWAATAQQLFVWGAQWTMVSDHIESTPFVYYTPEEDTLHTFSTFIQSSTKFFDDTLTFVLGTKLEHNDIAGFQIHPSGRLTWTPDQNNTFWGAISRAPRTVGRGTSDLNLIAVFVDLGDFGGPPGVLYPWTMTGSRDMEPEELIAYEAGYRTHLTNDLTLDSSLYFNDYTNLLNIDPDTYNFTNDFGGQILGSELNLTWQPANTFKLEAGYSYAHTNINGRSFSTLNFNQAYPNNQFHLRSYLDIGRDLELNSALYYVDNVPTYNAESYIRLDVGLTWRLNEQMQISLWGQNLLDPKHLELREDELNQFNGEVPRSFYVQLNMTF